MKNQYTGKPFQLCPSGMKHSGNYEWGNLDYKYKNPTDFNICTSQTRQTTSMGAAEHQHFIMHTK
jgi:hypothetical protein